MPRRADSDKHKARSLGRDSYGSDVAAWFELLNTGKATIDLSAFFYAIHVEDDGLRAAVRHLSELMRSAAVSGHDTLAVDVDAVLQQHFPLETGDPTASADPPKSWVPGFVPEHQRVGYWVSSAKGTAPGAADLRRQVATWVNNMMGFFFLPDGCGGFRCVARCQNDQCRRWFFQFDDRAVYCGAPCWPSKTPERKRAAVKRHRVNRVQ